eukprot:jgi/Mesvir1/9381/Mv09832-RA.1
MGSSSSSLPHPRFISVAGLPYAGTDILCELVNGGCFLGAAIRNPATGAPVCPQGDARVGDGDGHGRYRGSGDKGGGERGGGDKRGGDKEGEGKHLGDEGGGAWDWSQRMTPVGDARGFVEAGAALEGGLMDGPMKGLDPQRVMWVVVVRNPWDWLARVDEEGGGDQPSSLSRPQVDAGVTTGMGDVGHPVLPRGVNEPEENEQAGREGEEDEEGDGAMRPGLQKPWRRRRVLTTVDDDVVVVDHDDHASDDDDAHGGDGNGDYAHGGVSVDGGSTVDGGSVDSAPAQSSEASQARPWDMRFLPAVGGGGGGSSYTQSPPRWTQAKASRWQSRSTRVPASRLGFVSVRLAGGRGGGGGDFGNTQGPAKGDGFGEGIGKGLVDGGGRRGGVGDGPGSTATIAGIRALRSDPFWQGTTAVLKPSGDGFGTGGVTGGSSVGNVVDNTGGRIEGGPEMPSPDPSTAYLSHNMSRLLRTSMESLVAFRDALVGGHTGAGGQAQAPSAKRNVFCGQFQQLALDRACVPWPESLFLAPDMDGVPGDEDPPTQGHDPSSPTPRSGRPSLPGCSARNVSIATCDVRHAQNSGAYRTARYTTPWSRSSPADQTRGMIPSTWNCRQGPSGGWDPDPLSHRSALLLSHLSLTRVMRHSYVVRFEDLVARPLEVVKDLAKRGGFRVSSRCEQLVNSVAERRQFEEAVKRVRTRSYMDRFSSHERETVQAGLDQGMETRLGYSLESGGTLGVS